VVPIRLGLVLIPVVAVLLALAVDAAVAAHRLWLLVPLVALLPLADWAPVDARERRERMAHLYLRRGFVDSAHDEWAAACQELGPDAAALAGLAAVAIVRGDDDDAELFARAAQDLDPAHAGAGRVLERLGL